MSIGRWSAQTMAHTRHLLETIGPRGSATPAERAAAAYAQTELARAGMPVTVQPFRSPTSAWRPFAYVMGLAVIAAALAPLARPGSSLLAGALCLLGLWLLAGELRLRNTPLRYLLPHGDSQNVIGRLLPAGEVKERVVLVAHLDTHRTPFFHQTRARQAVLDRLLALAFVGFPFNAAIFLLAALAPWPWLFALALPFSLLHLFGLAVSLHTDLTPYSPGANDNAVSVAAVLTLAEELARQPLQETEVWALFSGCEEVGCYGMRAFIDAYRPELGQAAFIDFEMVGRGEPGIVTEEGLLARLRYDPDLVQLAAAAAAAVWGPAHLKIGGAYGESVITHQAGYRSVTLNAVLPATGEPVAWHRPDDDLRVVDEATLGRVVAWGLEILRRIDGGHKFTPTKET